MTSCPGLRGGAAAALVRRDAEASPAHGHCLLEVEDTLHALGQLAGAGGGSTAPWWAAVTGSNGKTTTKEMLAAILGHGTRCWPPRAT